MVNTGTPEWVLSQKQGTKEKGYTDPDWSVHDNAPQGGNISFFHTCTFNLSTHQIVVMGGAKEFGEGFYTCSAENDIPSKIIADKWFQIKQERYDWHIIAFALPADLLLRKLLGKNNMALAPTLRFYLEHATGYPKGGKNPNAADIEGINAINRCNRVLIFPDNKQTKVAYGPGTETKSWIDFVEAKVGGGDYRLVIGPQQPEYMLNYRQYAWTTGWGIWLINNGLRYYRFKNYQIKNKQRISLNGSWPKGHPKIDENGSKIK